MEKHDLLTRCVSHGPAIKLAGLCFAISGLLALSTEAIASENYSATEWLQESVQNAMPAADILTLLEQTVGKDAASGLNPGPHQLRQGLYVTAIPDCSNIILRFDVNRGATTQRYRIADVPISDKLGSEFFEFVQAALTTAESVYSSDQYAQPWKLALNAESDSGGQLTITVQGDATAHFTLSWNFASPKRPIDSFIVPTAFGSKNPGTENINAVVHFPITLQEFEFLTNIYGVGQRYHDFPLYPHNWLHLTVTNGPANEYVTVHFDAITTNGQRVFVAQAPASLDVGGRFLNETITRMQEMLNEEAAKAGSSGPFETSFPYQDPEYGVVTAVVTGQQGVFEVAYNLQTATEYVQPGDQGDNH
jgi:hypothetical protein